MCIAADFFISIGPKLADVRAMLRHEVTLVFIINRIYPRHNLTFDWYKDMRQIHVEDGKYTSE